MKKTLKRLYQENQGKLSDKWSLYLDEWERLFKQYRDQQINILEIGIQNGGSLEVWSRYFSNAEKIVGSDIDPKCEILRYEDDRIKVIIGDANACSVESEILRLTSTFDIIIDDGSHKSNDVVRSFAHYFPHIRDGGIYLVEDLHTSYWKDYEGGLYNPYSAMAFFKRLADIVNYEHWRNNKPRWSLLKVFAEDLGIEFEELELTRIHSIEFINSLCIIKKSKPEKNILGKRVIVGTDEYVSSGWKKLNGTLIQDFAMTIAEESNLDVFELIKSANSLTISLTEKERFVQALTAQVAERDQSVQALTAQVSEKDQSVLALTAQLAEKDQSVLTLTAQLAEKDQSVHVLTTQLNRVIRDLDQTKEEVLKYALSKSWRITRPLRKLKKFFRGKNA